MGKGGGSERGRRRGSAGDTRGRRCINRIRIPVWGKKVSTLSDSASGRLRTCLCVIPPSRVSGSITIYLVQINLNLVLIFTHYIPVFL